MANSCTYVQLVPLWVKEVSKAEFWFHCFIQMNARHKTEFSYTLPKQSPVISNLRAKFVKSRLPSSVTIQDTGQQIP